MVKSRNQMILDLTAPLTEKYVYKVPIQREARGSLPSFGVLILPDYSQESSWRTFFLRGKRRIDLELDIPVTEALP